MRHAMNVPNAALVDEKRLLGTWKLESLVYEVTSTGQRSSPLLINYGREYRN